MSSTPQDPEYTGFFDRYVATPTGVAIGAVATLALAGKSVVEAMSAAPDDGTPAYWVLGAAAAFATTITAAHVESWNAMDAAQPDFEQ